MEIDSPIYGAIAQVTNASGHGHHVGFVFAKTATGSMILLGGNQKDRIKFSEFKVKPTADVIKVVNGKSKKIKGNKEYLRFFVPIAYEKQAKLDVSDKGINEDAVKNLNKNFGIKDDDSSETEH